MTMVALREFDPSATEFTLIAGEFEITYQGSPVWFKSIVQGVPIRAGFDYPLEFIINDVQGAQHRVQTSYGDANGDGYFELSMMNEDTMTLSRDYPFIEMLYVKQPD